jgi:hypothetical protein
MGACRWAKSNSAGKTKKTKEWFQRMKSMYNSGNKEARPNSFSYVTLISSIAKSGEHGAAAESEEVLFEMFNEYKNGNKEVKPNTQGKFSSDPRSFSLPKKVMIVL